MLVGSISVSAATTTKTASFTLSKTDKTEKKWTKSVTVSSRSATIVAQHWKGCTFPTYSDTAYSKILSSNGLSSRKVKVSMYNKTSSDPVVTGSAELYVNKEIGYGIAVGKTKHVFTLTKGSTTLKYKVSGTL